jgi:hypothetical protein
MRLGHVQYEIDVGTVSLYLAVLNVEYDSGVEGNGQAEYGNPGLLGMVSAK